MAALQQNGRGAQQAEAAKDRKIATLEAKLVQKNEVGRTPAGARAAKKRAWGTRNGSWVPHDTRDEIVDYVRDWAEKTELAQRKIIGWVGIAPSKFYNWRNRLGKVNEHNALVPRDHWLLPREPQAIRSPTASWNAGTSRSRLKPSDLARR